MRQPDRDALEELAEWRPPGGVVSIYLDVDPADRGEGWRIELRNGLTEAVERARDGAAREARLELEATAARVLERFPAEATHPEGRAQIGFVEVAKRGRERWFAAQLPLASTVVSHAPRPFLVPLVAMLDRGRARAIAAVSAERVRMLRWELGSIAEVDSWGLEIFSLDWRERKAQRSADPGRVQGSKAAGRDQFDQRLEANRERFLQRAGGLAAAEAVERECAELLVFGEGEHLREFVEGAGDRLTVHELAGHNLISAAPAEVGERVDEAVDDLAAARAEALVAGVSDEALGGSRGALGPQETLEALVQGRVEHLVLDPERAHEPAPAPIDGEDPAEARLPLPERLIGLALATSARVTPVGGKAAERLAEADGVAALLRY